MRGKLVHPSQLSQAMSGRKLDCSMRFVEGPAVLQAMAAPIGKGAVELAVEHCRLAHLVSDLRLREQVPPHVTSSARESARISDRTATSPCSSGTETASDRRWTRSSGWSMTWNEHSGVIREENLRPELRERVWTEAVSLL